MTEWAVSTAVDLTKAIFSGGSSSGPGREDLGTAYGKSMGAYIQALAESLNDLQDAIDE